MQFIKGLVIAAVVIAFLSFLFALPLWLLWPCVASMTGAPVFGYLTWAGAIGFVGSTWAMVYGGGKTVQAVCTTVAEMLPDP